MTRVATGIHILVYSSQVPEAIHTFSMAPARLVRAGHHRL